MDVQTFFKTYRVPRPRRGFRQISNSQARRNRNLAKLKARLIEERGEMCEAPPLFRAYARRVAGDVDYRIRDAHSECTRRAVDLHHVVARSLGGKDRDDNALLLCRQCHIFTEVEPSLAQAVGLVRVPGKGHVAIVPEPEPDLLTKPAAEVSG